ncbi:hypothetical protein ACT4_042_00020 [Acinetobacter sp. NBRC 100985]|nr:hypothetical protein ACT4_042_00020 [Acinetobacter sp. NBRC 100985]
MLRNDNSGRTNGNTGNNANANFCCGTPFLNKIKLIVTKKMSKPVSSPLKNCSITYPETAANKVRQKLVTIFLVDLNEYKKIATRNNM